MLNLFDFSIVYTLNTSLGNALCDHIFYWITQLGNGYLTSAIVLLIIVKPLSKQFRPVTIWWILLAIGASATVNGILKVLLSRPRPMAIQQLYHVSLRVVDIALYNNSMPSGHTMSAFLGFAIIAFIKPNYKRISFYLAVLVALSRIYLGVHYITDTIVGATIGVFIPYLILSLQRNKLMKENS